MTKKKASGFLYTAEFYGGELFINKSKGLLTGKEITTLQLKGYPMGPDGELLDQIKFRTFDLSECSELEIESFLLSISDTDTIGSITFALVGGCIDGQDFPPKLVGARRVR